MEEDDDNRGNIAPPEEMSETDIEAERAPAPYDALTPDLIISAVESVGYICDGRILALNSYENRVYQIGIEEEQPLIAKFYRPQRWSDEQILEEHQFTQELFDQELPVVPPILIDSETLFNFGGFRFSLSPRKGGHAPELDNLDHLLILGRLMGRIHAAGARETFQYRQHLSIETTQENADFVHSAFIPADLAVPYKTLCDDLITKVRRVFDTLGDYEVIRLHGDCHAGNILWRDDNPLFVDFDDAIMGPAMQDIWMFLSGDRAFQSAQIAEIVDGYNEFYDFPVPQLGLCEALRSLRFINYSAWLARRWHDPAFPVNFPWFNSTRYWSEHILELREQLALLDEPPLRLF